MAALLIAPLLAGLASAREPNEQEQYFVELINRARMDPAAEVALYELGDLNEGPPNLALDPADPDPTDSYTIAAGPHQPLAIDLDLVDTAGDYALQLNNADMFCHDCLGTTTDDRLAAAGFSDVLTGRYGKTESNKAPGRENLAFHAEKPSNKAIDDLTAAMQSRHEGLFVDTTVDGRGHRSTMMYGEWQVVGVGVNEGMDLTVPNEQGGPWDSLYVVTDFAHRADQGPFITGVAYDDLDGDDFYTPDAGEARGGLLVEVFRAGTETLVGSALTYGSGGYAVKVTPGRRSYDVVFSDDGIRMLTVSDVEVKPDGINGAGINTKVDYVPEPSASASTAAALSTLLLLSARRVRRRKIAR